MVPNMLTELHINSVVTQRNTEETGFDSCEFFCSQMSPKELWGPASLLQKGTEETFRGETCLCIRVHTYLYLVQRLLTRGFTPPLPHMPELYCAKLSIKITLFYIIFRTTMFTCEGKLCMKSGVRTKISLYL
jgi:hypothetical protein